MNRLVGKLALLLLLLALVAGHAAAETLRIGVLAYRGAERAVRDWQPHADYLGWKLAPRRFEVVPLTLAEFAPAVANRRIDLLITNTGHYVELDAGGKLARIATMRIAGPNGPVDRFGGVAIARAERSDLQGYADLRGKRVLVPDLNAFGGLQVHLPEARAAGIDLLRDTGELVPLQSHDRIVASILAGEGDAGFIRSGLLESLAAAGKLDPARIRVIHPNSTPGFPYAHSTALYPQWPFARLDHVSEDLTKDILIALLELPPDHPAAHAAEIHGWTLPSNYQPVHELFLEFRIGPYADLPVRFGDLMRRYGSAMLVGGTATIALLLVSLSFMMRVNRQLEQNREQLQLAAGVFEHAQEGIIIADAKGDIVEANDTFLGLTGYARDEVIGRNPRFLASGHQDKDFYRDMWNALLENGFWRGELWNRRKDGRLYVQQTSISTVRAEDGRVSHFIGLSSDITELKESQSKLEQMAFYDALTGLPNRRMLSDRLQQAMAFAQRNERLLAVCYLDLDGFKPVNDNWGHAAGDRLLVEAARRLLTCVRGGDTVSRLGGDEFVVLLGNLAHLDECEAALERLRHALGAPFPLPEGEAVLSASIGVTLFPLDSSDVDTLIRHADQAMYVSKQAGRNRHTLFDVESDQLGEIKLQSSQGIRAGLERNEFRLFYQPKVNMRTGRVIGAEALIRWQHPERGLLQPSAFLPVIEFVGMQSEVGLWVLETALRQAEIWRSAGLDLVVGVNIAAQQLQSDGFVVALQEMLARHPGVPASQIELEILETAALDDLTHVAAVIESCHALGIRFAIDDFGTGYSSLTYLKQLQAGALKIDQSFIRDMLDDPEDLAIVDGIVGLASAFRREVIAEGVETPAHGRMLLQLGCDMAQGYGIARPMPAERLPDWIASWRPPEEWRAARAWPREDLPLLTVEIDHLRWVRQFAAALQDKDGAANRWPQLDHQECRFGLWLKGSGKAKYGRLAAFDRMAEAHAEVHAVGAAIVRDHQADPVSARERMHEIHACRDRLLARLAELRAAAGLPAA